MSTRIIRTISILFCRFALLFLFLSLHTHTFFFRFFCCYSSLYCSHFHCFLFYSIHLLWRGGEDTIAEHKITHTHTRTQIQEMAIVLNYYNEIRRVLCGKSCSNNIGRATSCTVYTCMLRRQKLSFLHHKMSNDSFGSCI